MPEETPYQAYNSARDAQQLITPDGKKIKFVKGQYITDDQEIIGYLNSEITRKALPGITKGRKMASAEANPMEALRAQHFKEFEAAMLAEKQRKVVGGSRDLGSTESASNFGGSNSKNLVSQQVTPQGDAVEAVQNAVSESTEAQESTPSVAEDNPALAALRSKLSK